MTRPFKDSANSKREVFFGKEITINHMKCPRCKKNTLNANQLMNAISRRDNKTIICSQCGIDESISDYSDKFIKK